MHVQGVIGETYNTGTQKERQVVEVACDMGSAYAQHISMPGKTDSLQGLSNVKN